MKKILTLGFILFLFTARAQSWSNAVSCNGKTYYVRATFTDTYVPVHDISTTICPDNTLHNDTEEGDYLNCKMELFADAGFTVPVAVDPRFFSFAPDVPGSTGTMENPTFFYRYECAAPLPAASTYADNWRTDRSVIQVQQCIWECVGAGYYNCYTAGPGMPANYNIVINCCYAPGALAVHLLSFEAVRSLGVNTLSWVLADKADFSRLEVERSLDGFSYSVVYATGDFNVDRFLDSTSVTTYYRLKVYSTSGAPFYSSVVVLKAAPDLKRTIFVSPSPFVNRLQVAVTAVSPGPVVFRLVAVDGREIFHASRNVVAGMNAFTFDVPAIARGVYIFSISDGEGTLARKVMKN